MNSKFWAVMVLTFLVFLMAAGCGGANQGSGSVVGNGQVAAPSGAEQPVQSQGVGAQNYSNAELGISFQYPVGWNVVPQVGHQKVTVQSPDRSAEWTVEVVGDVSRHKVGTLEELEAVLKELTPELKWNRVEVAQKRTGLRAEEVVDQSQVVKVYIPVAPDKIWYVEDHALVDSGLVDEEAVMTNSLQSYVTEVAAP